MPAPTAHSPTSFGFQTHPSSREGVNANLCWPLQVLLLRESFGAKSADDASSKDNELSVLIAEGRQGGLVGGLGQLTQLGHRADEPWMGPCPCWLLSDKHRDQGYYTHMAGWHSMSCAKAHKEISQAERRLRATKWAEPQGCRATMFDLI